MRGYNVTRSSAIEDEIYMIRGEMAHLDVFKGDIHGKMREKDLFTI